MNDPFFERVYRVVEHIPFGRVTSYGAIGRYLGSARSARMVGWAMNACVKNEKQLPAHRVVNRNGLLTGKAHFGEPNAMQMLLEAEGVEIDDNQVQDFKRRFWDPIEELPPDLY